MMELDHETCYRTCAAGDARFDGIFFVGVTTTGIYCRTVCRARKPKRENCRFFSNASRAEQAGFRPCKLCRPEQSPGQSAIDLGSTIVSSAVHCMENAMLGEEKNLESLAMQLEVSGRHLRRVFQEKMGVSPVQFVQTQRLHMAKRLLSETQLPIGQIALASGFRSVRRCNALFKSTYGRSPSDFRNHQPTCGASKIEDALSIALTLGYRPPYDWSQLLAFLKARAVLGVEWIDEVCYSRTLRIGDRAGWLRVSHLLQRHALRIEVSSELLGSIQSVLSAVRRSFDLDASPSVISDSLLGIEPLRSSVKLFPGLRLPGTMDGFETAIRTIIGQQVSVAAATTVMGRLVKSFGQPIETPWPQLHLTTITPEGIARRSIQSMTSLGLTTARAKTILALARTVADGKIQLQPSPDPERSIAELQRIDGIGPWTANYIGMRILGWPDAFLANDLVIRKQLAPMKLGAIEKLSHSWRPWRAYAVMHLWNNASLQDKAKAK